MGIKYFSVLTFIMVFSAFTSMILQMLGVPVIVCMAASFCIGFFGFAPTLKWVFKDHDFPEDEEEK